MLADDAVIAVIHFLEERELTRRDREALERAQDIFETVAALDSRHVVGAQTLRTMAPISALDETFDAVAGAGRPQGDLLEVIQRIQATVDAILAGDAERDDALEVKGLFDRLADITLAKTEQVTRPSRHERYEWIKTALTS